MDIPEMVKPRLVEIKLKQLHTRDWNAQIYHGILEWAGLEGTWQNLALNTSRDRAATTRHLFKLKEKETHVENMWDIFSAFL